VVGDLPTYELVAELVAEIVGREPWVVDFGLRAYCDDLETPLGEDGAVVSFSAYLGVDPFTYFEQLAKDRAVPSLIYTWRVERIGRETAPWIEQEPGFFVRDHTKRAFAEVRENGWEDDAGDLRPRMDAHRSRASASKLDGCLPVSKTAKTGAKTPPESSSSSAPLRRPRCSVQSRLKPFASPAMASSATNTAPPASSGRLRHTKNTTTPAATNTTTPSAASPFHCHARGSRRHPSPPHESSHLSVRPQRRPASSATVEQHHPTTARRSARRRAIAVFVGRGRGTLE